MKKALLLLVFVAACGGGAYWYFVLNVPKPEPTVTKSAVTRGNVVDTVSTTGALSAVSQVVVGAQVSGIVLELNADFNSIVKKDQWLAKIDPQTVLTQIQSQEANMTRSETDLDRSKVSLDDSKKKFERSKDLLAKGLITQDAFDTTELNLHQAEAAYKSSQAALLQSKASLDQQKLNLEHTTIMSPIDGIVIARSVDAGQTVNSSQNAPPIFTIAADLTKMKVIAGVDESDVGRIRPLQHVTFRVDAQPNDVFTGTVEQVRLDPKMQQNVVTYQVVITVPNPEFKLRPGMTANLNIEISRIDDVLRVPNAALRFRPTNDMYTALGLEPPAPPAGGGRGGAGRNAGPGAPGAPGAPGGAAGRAGNGEQAAAAAPARGAAGAAPAAGATPGNAQAGRSTGPRPSGNNGGGSGAMTAEQMAARMQNMTPEERAAMAARGGRGGNRGGGQGGQGGGQNADSQNRGRGGNRGGGQGFNGQNARNPNGRGGNGNANGNGRGGNGQGRGGRPNQPNPEEAPVVTRGGATTIDAFFPTLIKPETRGRAWTWDKEKKELKSINVRLGITDGQVTQLIEGELTEGEEVVTNVIVAAVRPGLNQQQGNPFLQQQGGRGGPGGGGPGGGGGGGGNRGGGGGGGRGGF